MRRSVAAILLVGLLTLAGRSAWPADAQAGGCQLAPVFVMLRDLVGRERIGECVGLVVRNDAGELSQQTTLGMMTFRPNDMVALFSDGQTTWLYGPRGLESRPSTSRLAWEAGGAPAPNSGSAAATTTNGAPTTTPTPAGATSSSAPWNTANSSTAGGVPANSPSASGSGAVSVSAAPGSAPGISAATSSPSPALAASALPIEVDGSTSSTSNPFDLAGGDYRVTWAIEREGGADSCYVGVRLRRSTETSAPGRLVLHTTLNTSNDTTSSGESRLFAVPPGRYALDVMTTGCSWKIGLYAPR